MGRFLSALRSRPGWQRLLAIGLAALMVRSASALLINTPGYTDGFYYYHVAANLYTGKGFVEDFVWNFLTPAPSISHASNTYWGPLASILVLPAFWAFGPSFRAAQIPVVLLAALVPVLSYVTARHLGLSNRQGLVAAVLTTFSGMYFLFWTVPDGYVPFALAGGVALLAISKSCGGGGWRWSALAGLCIALAQLARSDGVLLVAVFLFAHLLQLPRWQRRRVIIAGGSPSPAEAPRRTRPFAPLRAYDSFLRLGQTEEPHPFAPLRAGSNPFLREGEGTGRACCEDEGTASACRPHPITSHAVVAGASPSLRGGESAAREAVPIPEVELATQRGKDAAGSAHLRVHVGKLVGHCLALGVAYLATMSPWLYRNWVDLGIPLHNPGLNTMFLREYSDMFTYGAQIDLSHYLSLGWDAIVRSKLQAGLRHLQIVAEALSYLLVPLAALGVWLLRRNRRALPFIAYLAALYVAMAFAFSLPGQFGSLLHSLAALLPFLMATVAVGLDAGIDALARRRPHLSPTTLKLVLTGVVVGAQIALTLGLASIAARTWESRYSFALYPQAAEWLDARLAPGEPVLILDPPAFAYFGARPAVVVPNNDLDTLVSIARRYAARYLVLEPAHMPAVKPLYRGDESHAALTPRVEIRNDRGQELKIYEVE